MPVPLESVDVEDRIMQRSEELAQKRFSQSFDDLTSHQQMSVWVDAEFAVHEELREAAERSWDALREHAGEMQYMRKVGK